MNDDRDQIFVDVKSSNSFRSLKELVDDAFDSKRITLCQYRIGSHIPIWRKARKGDPVLYAIDDVGCAGGEIIYLLKRAFRPRWYPDNAGYNDIIHFAEGMNPKFFDKQWASFMIQQHHDAIERKRWMFLVLAMFDTTYHLEGNRSILLQKIKDMSAADDELEKDAAKMLYGDFAYEGESEGYCG